MKNTLRTYSIVDFFSGLGGFSQAFADHGYNVLKIDIERFPGQTIQADILQLPLKIFSADLFLFSPPCTEFSREFFPWSKTGKEPSTLLVECSLQIIQKFKPKFWVIENTKGSVKYISKFAGKPWHIVNPYYLWSNFFLKPQVKFPGGVKTRLKDHSPSARSKIHYKLSDDIRIIFENSW